MATLILNMLDDATYAKMELLVSYMIFSGLHIYNEVSGREFLSDNEKFTTIVDITGDDGDRYVPKPELF